MVIQPDEFLDSLDKIDTQRIAWKAGLVLGTSNQDMNSYRAELAGILHAIKFTNESCRSAQIQKGKCNLYCDNKGALAASFGRKCPTPNWSLYNLL